MPIFEYRCNKCGHNMEFLEKSSGKNRHSCAKCGSSDIQKLFSSFAVGKSSQGNGACPTGTCGLS